MIIKIKLKIGGMTCASCSNAVERSLKRLKGIVKAEVNLVSTIATIEFDDALTNVKNIEKTIENTGYYVVKSAEEKGISSARIIANFAFAIPLFYIAMAPMLHLPSIPYFNLNHPFAFALLQFGLTIPMIVLNYSLFIKGFKSALKGSPNMDSLVAIGTSAAFLYSVYSLIRIALGNHEAAHHLYFESSAIILALIVFGKYLETKNKRKTNDAVMKLTNLRPSIVHTLKDNIEIDVRLENIQIGDVIIIKDGESIPCDGRIIEGYGLMDESMLTGESLPVYKEKGTEVFAGTLNTNGHFYFKAEKLNQDTILGKIIQLIENTNDSKAPIAKLADRISSVFVPVVMVIALVAFILWVIVSKDFEFSLKIFVSVLVIACPCALGLATPTAIIVGTGIGAKNGILYKNAEILENTNQIDTIFFDKTGTLTTGEFIVSDLKSFKYEEKKFLEILYSIEKLSSHPLAKSIVKYAEEKAISLNEVTNYQSIPGQGLRANIANHIYKIGNQSWVNVPIDKLVEGTILYVSEDDNYIGYIALKDEIHSDALSLMQRLKANHIHPVILSGDSYSSVQTVATALQVDDFRAALLPQDKLDILKKAQQQGHHVMMVGDGINDSPSLTQADIGVAISKGSDITIESSDIVLLKNNLLDVYKAIEISKKTLQTIQQNLFFAFAYNVIGIPIAFGLLYPFTGLLLNPIIAALAMSLSSISVVSNALRLKRKSFK